MSIKIGNIKFVWFKNIYDWVMTGIIGPNGKWFLGYSKKSQIPITFDKSTENSTSNFLLHWTGFIDYNVKNEIWYKDIVIPEYFQKLTPDDPCLNISIDSSDNEASAYPNRLLQIQAREIALTLRSSDFYMKSTNTTIVQLINVFERFSHGQASLEAVKLALYNFRLSAFYPTILQYFLQQPQEVTKRVKAYILKLPKIHSLLDKAIENINKWEELLTNGSDKNHIIDLADSYLEGLRLLNEETLDKYNACSEVLTFLGKLDQE